MVLRYWITRTSCPHFIIRLRRRSYLTVSSKKCCTVIVRIMVHLRLFSKVKRDDTSRCLCHHHSVSSRPAPYVYPQLFPEVMCFLSRSLFPYRILHSFRLFILYIHTPAIIDSSITSQSSTYVYIYMMRGKITGSEVILVGR